MIIVGMQEGGYDLPEEMLTGAGSALGVNKNLDVAKVFEHVMSMRQFVMHNISLSYVSVVFVIILFFL